MGGNWDEGSLLGENLIRVHC